MDHSQKRTLVLLPGLDGTGILFNNLVDQLEEKFQIVRISYPPSTDHSLDDLAEIVKNKIEDPHKTLLLAESFSGLVALTLLEKWSIYPKGIIFGMCFVDPPCKALLRLVSKFQCRRIPWAYVPNFMYRKFCLGNSATREQIKNLKQVLSEVSPGVFLHRLRLIETFRISEKTKKFNIPCLYVQATNDRLVSSKSAGWFAKNFSPFSLKQIAGPHFLFQSKAKQGAVCILDFDQYLEADKKSP